MLLFMGINLGSMNNGNGFGTPMVNCNLQQVEAALGRPATSMADLMTVPVRPLTASESLYLMGKEQQIK